MSLGSGKAARPDVCVSVSPPHQFTRTQIFGRTGFRRTRPIFLSDHPRRRRARHEMSLTTRRRTLRNDNYDVIPIHSRSVRPAIDSYDRFGTL